MIGMGAVLLNGVTCSGNVVFLVRNRLFDWNRSMLELLQVASAQLASLYLASNRCDCSVPAAARRYDSYFARALR